MAYRSFLPQGDSQLLGWALNASAKVNAAAAAYGVPTAVATAFVAKTQAFQVAMAANEAGQRSKLTVLVKNQARAALRLQAGYVSRLVQGTAACTDEMKAAAGFNVRVPPAHRPAPADEPVLIITGVTHNTVGIELRPMGSSKRGLAPDATSATVFSYIGDEPPTTATGWKFESATTKTRFELVFDDALPMGTKVFICAFWANAKMESGPACSPQMAVLTGGAALPAATEGIKLAA